MKLTSKVVHVRLEQDLREYIEARATRERRSQVSLIKYLIAQAARADAEQQTSASAA